MSEKQEKPFYFLTTAEFSRLTQEEKMEYIDRAIEELKARGEGVHLFDESKRALDRKKDK